MAVALLWVTVNRRKAKQAYGVPNNPLWLDALVVLVPVLLVFAFTAAMNAYRIPSKDEPQGIPIPVLIWAAVAFGLSFLVHRTRFGQIGRAHV